MSGIWIIGMQFAIRVFLSLETSMYRQRSRFIKNLLFCWSNFWLSAWLSFSLALSFQKLKWLIREMPSGVGYADLCTAVLNRNAHPIIGESEIENVRCYILARQIRPLREPILRNGKICCPKSWFYFTFLFGDDSSTQYSFSFDNLLM